MWSNACGPWLVSLYLKVVALWPEAINNQATSHVTRVFEFHLIQAQPSPPNPILHGGSTMNNEIESAPAAVVILPALCGPPGATRSSAWPPSGVQDVYCNPATTKGATWPRIVRAVLICVEGRRVVSSFRFLCNEKGMINQERIGAADGSHNRHLGQCAHALRCGLLTVLI